MMLGNSIVDLFPPWVLFILTLFMILGSIELGWQLGSRYRKTHQNEPEAPIGTIIGSMLGLLAFFLAFTFSMAASRYEDRKQLVLREANAIGTAYLRADTLPEPQNAKIQGLLREYVRLRIWGAKSGEVTDAVVQAGILHDELWSEAVNAAQVNQDSILTGLFIQSLNEVIDLDESRITASRNRIPDTIWITLYVLTIFTTGAIGYQLGLSGLRNWTVILALTIVLAMVMTLIADLDLSRSGLVQVSQQPLIDLFNKIGRASPAP